MCRRCSVRSISKLMIFDTDQLRAMTGKALATVDVYLIAQLEWAHVLCGVAIKPADAFKIGYSTDPFLRVRHLRGGSTKNLALFGVILCADEATAAKTESAAHDILSADRGRGEWFHGNAEAAWRQVGEQFPALWLTRYYTINLDAMRLAPFARGDWG